MKNVSFDSVDAIVRSKVSIPEGYVLRGVDMHMLYWLVKYRRETSEGVFDMDSTKFYVIDHRGGEEVKESEDA